MKTTLKRTWAEIDLDSLIYNYQTLRRWVGPKVKFLGVVKADAYGHGAVRVSRALEEAGADYLAVSNLDEARDLRNHGICLPILILGITPPEMTPLLIANDVTQAIYSEETAQEFNNRAAKCGGVLKTHLKLDTGMSRLGLQCDEDHATQTEESVLRICVLPNLNFEGVFMHFAVSDEEGEDCHAYTQLQYRRFSEMLERLKNKGVTFAIRHCANSGATVDYKEYAMDMIRPGILTYGLTELSRKLNLRPVMSLKTTVGSIKEMSTGTTISYGRTYATTRNSRIAVLPIGYADGFFRSISNHYSVYVSGGQAPLRGRICMDMCMVDVTEIPNVHVGDCVEIFGTHNSCDELAKAAQTIPYELICAVSKRVPRVYMRGGAEIAQELWIPE